ncbi:MAG: NAD-dependent epimerase/dehydratase family protein [Candidatus Beckwithbacteria bacterium]
MNQLADLIIKETKRIDKEVDLARLRGKTVILTGASGLIGTYFLASLRQLRGVKLVAVIQSKPLQYWRQLADFSGCQVVRGDLTKLITWQKLPKADYIIHTAGYGQPARFLAEPMQTLKLNTLAVFKLLEKLKPKGKFLYISSSEIYTRAEINHPRYVYIEAKKAGEAICRTVQSQGTAVKICRLSLAYGPGTKKEDSRVLNQLIVKGLAGKVSLLDRGEAKRTYGYVTDSVSIMWQILLKGKKLVYNVAGESQTTIYSLAKKISQYLKVPLVRGQKNKGVLGAPEIVKIDISQVKKEFNKLKFVSLSEGLKQTINWQRQLYAA